MSRMNLRPLLFAASAAALLAGCRKEFDTPPVRTIPVGDVLTVAQLKALYTTERVRFTNTQKSVYAVVTSDETDGNFYKNITVQDATGGITLRLQNSGGLYVGDSIRIYLPGTVLAPYNGLMQLDSVDVDNNIIKQATQVNVPPRVVTIPELEANITAWQSTLIKLEDVEFVAEDAAGSTWANAITQTVGERFLEDCDGNEVMVRTSGYSSYAGQPLPQGKGSIVCVVGLFGTTIQLGNRSLASVQLNGPRCPGQELPFFIKDFQDQSLTSGGWTEQVVSGTNVWEVSDAGSTGNFYAVSNNFNQGASETWLISPAIDITGLTAPKLSFRNACRFSGPSLEVYVSTTYDGSSTPNPSDWVLLDPVLDQNTASFVWTSSGLLDISAQQSPTFRVAFRYRGGASDGRAWEVDDIKIVE
jgi:hypothetical protein